MDNETPDVTTGETTSPDSSPERETTTAETAETPEAEVKTVPYDRFAEIINDRNELKTQLSTIQEQLKGLAPKPEPEVQDPNKEVIKSQLKNYLNELGYVSKEDLERREAEQQVMSQVENLKTKYDGKDGRPKYDHGKVLEYASKNLIGNLESAYTLMNQAELTNWAISKALGTTKGTKSEISDGSGARVGTSNDDLMKAAQSGDQDAMQMLIKRAL